MLKLCRYGTKYYMQSPTRAKSMPILKSSKVHYFSYCTANLQCSHYLAGSTIRGLASLRCSFIGAHLQTNHFLPFPQLLFCKFSFILIRFFWSKCWATEAFSLSFPSQCMYSIDDLNAIILLKFTNHCATVH